MARDILKAAKSASNVISVQQVGIQKVCVLLVLEIEEF